MARRKHVKAAVPGAGRDANRGTKTMAQADFEKRRQEAIDSVPHLKFDHTGQCVVENVTAQQVEGLTAIAAEYDKKIYAETGRKEAVWTVYHQKGDSDAIVVHNRYRSKHQRIEDSKRRIALVGRLNFHRGLADYLPESDEHEQGLLELIAEQNRLAAKYEGRAEWHYRKGSDGRYFVSKKVLQAS